MSRPAVKLNPPERVVPVSFKEACERAGYGMPSQQRELCKKAGVSWQTLRKWVADRRIKTIRTETEIVCRKLGPLLKLEPWEVLTLIRKY